MEMLVLGGVLQWQYGTLSDAADTS